MQQQQHHLFATIEIFPLKAYFDLVQIPYDGQACQRWLSSHSNRQSEQINIAKEKAKTDIFCSELEQDGSDQMSQFFCSSTIITLGRYTCQEVSENLQLAKPQQK